MANHKSAKKRARQTIKKTARNTQVRSKFRTAIRKAKEAAAAGGDAVTTSLSAAISQIQKAANKGVIHRNAAARKISRLTKSVAPKKSA